MSAGARVHEYTTMQATIPLKGGTTIPYHSLCGDIEFHDVEFTYPTRPDQTILSNFNLKIPAGQMVNIFSKNLLWNNKNYIYLHFTIFYL
jgi:ABC-type multidrug transport system fused ATPase/permease subunit